MLDNAGESIQRKAPDSDIDDSDIPNPGIPAPRIPDPGNPEHLSRRIFILVSKDSFSL